MEMQKKNIFAQINFAFFLIKNLHKWNLGKRDIIFLNKNVFFMETMKKGKFPKINFTFLGNFHNQKTLSNEIWEKEVSFCLINV
jgi:hypothetical protein